MLCGDAGAPSTGRATEKALCKAKDLVMALVINILTKAAYGEFGLLGSSSHTQQEMSV